MKEITGKEYSSSIEHQGDHHYAKVKVQKGGKISAGAIYNFADNAAASVELSNGKGKANFVHAGKHHQLQGGVDTKGKIALNYSDTGKVPFELEINGNVADVKKGKIPGNKIRLGGKHHKVELSIDLKGRPSGTLTSRLTKNSEYKVSMKNGKLTGCTMTHKGKNHSVSITGSRDGSGKVSYTHGKGRTKFSFSIEKGRGKVRGFAGLKLSF